MTTSLEGPHEEGSPEQKILARYLEYVKNIDGCTEVHDRHEENWEFASALGSQWTKEAEEVLGARGRSTLSMDKIGPQMRMTTGEEALNKFRPRAMGRLRGKLPDGLASGLDELIDFQWRSSGTSSTVSSAFRDLYVCGYGVMYKYTDPLDLVGAILPIKDERVILTEMVWDTNAVEKNLEDRRWHARLKFIDQDEFKALWAKGQPEAVRRHMEAEGKTLPEGAGWGEVPESVHLGNTEDGKRAVIEMEWKEIETSYIVSIPEIGEEEFEDKETAVLYLSSLGLPEPDLVPIRPLKKRVVKYAFISGMAVLEHGKRSTFTYSFLTGFEAKKGGSVKWHGVVDYQKDPQVLLNKMWESSVVHFVAGPKGALIMEKDMVDDPEDFIDQFSSTTGVAWVDSGALSNPDGGQKYLHLPPPSRMAVPRDMFELVVSYLGELGGGSGALTAQNDLRRISGKVANEFLAQVRAANADLWDALRKWRRDDALTTIHMVKEFWDDETIFRIVNPGGPESEEIINVPPKESWDLTMIDFRVDEIQDDNDEAVELFDLLTRTGTLLQSLGPEAQVDLLPVVDEGKKEKMRAEIRRRDVLMQLAMAMSQLAQNPQGAQLLSALDQVTEGLVSQVLGSMQQQG